MVYAPAFMRRPMFLAIAFVLIGGIGACGTGSMLVPAVRAAQGGGVTGTFTLTEPLSCDRYPPPRQRCGWFGDFRSADGRTVRRDMELDPGLPPGAQVGDTIPARDTGSIEQIYQLDAGGQWRLPALLFGLFSAAFLAGVAVLRPWRWVRRIRHG